MNFPLRWVPPPNWPMCAPGWVPPPGWEPPREWGPVPEGWNFWQPDPFAARASKQRKGKIVASSVAGLVLFSGCVSVLGGGAEPEGREAALQSVAADERAVDALADAAAEKAAADKAAADKAAADKAAADKAAADKAAADKAAADAAAVTAAADKAAADKAAADKAAADAAAAKAAADKAAADKAAADAAAARQAEARAAEAAAAQPQQFAAPAAEAADGPSYANCTELREDYPGGVARPGAVDKRSGGGQARYKPVYDAALYEENSGKDRDGDQIACEA